MENTPVACPAHVECLAWAPSGGQRDEVLRWEGGPCAGVARLQYSYVVVLRLLALHSAFRRPDAHRPVGALGGGARCVGRREPHWHPSNCCRRNSPCEGQQELLKRGQGAEVGTAVSRAPIHLSSYPTRPRSPGPAPQGPSRAWRRRRPGEAPPRRAGAAVWRTVACALARE